MDVREGARERGLVGGCARRVIRRFNTRTMRVAGLFVVSHPGDGCTHRVNQPFLGTGNSVHGGANHYTRMVITGRNTGWLRRLFRPIDPSLPKNGL